MTFADLLQRWLKATQRTQVSVSEKGKIAKSKLSELATGTNPNPEWATIERIAAGFEVSTEQFLAGPRPEREAGHESRVGGTSLLEQLVAEAAAQDGTVESDIARAIAILGGALERHRHREPATRKDPSPRRGAVTDR